MKFLYHGSVMVIILFGICIGTIVLNVVLRYVAAKSTFCTPQGAIYQDIQANGGEWVDQSVSFVFSMDSGEQFRVQYYREPPGSPNVFYVMTGSDWSGGLGGTAGYLYVPYDQPIPRYWLANYWLTQLDDNIYCYKERGS